MGFILKLSKSITGRKPAIPITLNIYGITSLFYLCYIPASNNTNPLVINSIKGENCATST